MMQGGCLVSVDNKNGVYVGLGGAIPSVPFYHCIYMFVTYVSARVYFQ